jgi:hypothetical protein
MGIIVSKVLDPECASVHATKRESQDGSLSRSTGCYNRRRFIRPFSITRPRFVWRFGEISADESKMERWVF